MQRKLEESGESSLSNSSSSNGHSTPKSSPTIFHKRSVSYSEVELRKQRQALHRSDTEISPPKTPISVLSALVMTAFTATQTLTDSSPITIAAVVSLLSAATIALRVHSTRSRSLDRLHRLSTHLKSDDQTQLTFTGIVVKNMLDGIPAELCDTDFFYIGFGTKKGFADLIENSPLTHSSIVLIPKKHIDAIHEIIRDENEQQESKNQLPLTQAECNAIANQYAEIHPMFYVFGRQSDALSLKQKQGMLAAAYKTATQFFFAPQNRTDTLLDNEKNYDLFPNVPFQAQMTNVILSGAEFKQVAETVKHDVLSQACTMLRSNCYSASIYALGTMIKIIDNRATNQQDQQEMQKQDIAELAALMLQVAQNNTGEGILDNGTVVKMINDVLNICQKHGLLSITETNNLTQAMEKAKTPPSTRHSRHNSENPEGFARTKNSLAFGRHSYPN